MLAGKNPLRRPRVDACDGRDGNPRLFADAGEASGRDLAPAQHSPHVAPARLAAGAGRFRLRLMDDRVERF